MVQYRPYSGSGPRQSDTAQREHRLFSRPQPQPKPVDDRSPRQPASSGTANFRQPDPTPDEQNYVAFALNTPNSEAAKNLGLTDTSLSADQKSDVAGIAGDAQKTGTASMFGKMWDYIATLIESVISWISGNGFGDYGQKRAERTAMRVASETYDSLEKHGYGSLAPRVSGVERDAEGNYAAIHNPDGSLTGIMAREVAKIQNPNQVNFNDAVDLGWQASKPQVERSIRIFDEETTRLYSAPEVRARVEQYRELQKTRPGKDTEVDDFIRDNRAFINGIADRMIQEDRHESRFNFSEHRADLVQQIEARIREKHQELFDSHVAGDTPATPHPANLTPRMEHSDIKGGTHVEGAPNHGLHNATKPPSAPSKDSSSPLGKYPPPLSPIFDSG